ncbi:MAG: ATP-binding protein [Sulfitobacter sp.]
MACTQNYTLFDHVAAPIFVLELDEEGVPTYTALNERAQQQSDRPMSDFIGRTALDVYPGAYGRHAHARFCDVTRSGLAMTCDIDLPMDRGVSSLRTHLHPEKDAEGRVVRIFGTFQDLTAEQDANDAKDEFNSLSTEMEQFLALAAHDLRAPLSNIVAITNLIREEFEPLDLGQSQLFNMIENIVAKTRDLVGDVLNHTQTISAPRDETVFNFPAMCQNICDTLDPHRIHNVTTSMSTLRADRTAVLITLRNLTDNALKHGGKEKLDIDISVQSGLPGMIEITLTDNGKGFSEAALKVMNGGRFEPNGGYGLFGVKRLISSRGGTLQARNLPDGSGAVVRFGLPGELLGVHAKSLLTAKKGSARNNAA